MYHNIKIFCGYLLEVPQSTTTYFCGEIRKISVIFSYIYKQPYLELCSTLILRPSILGSTKGGLNRGFLLYLPFGVIGRPCLL